MEKREFWYGNKAVSVERLMENVQVNDGVVKNYVLFKTKCGGNVIVDEDKVVDLIPCKIGDGERVMFVSHGKVIGTTTTKIFQKDKRFVEIESAPARIGDLKAIPDEVSPIGFILKVDDVEIYYYCPKVCSQFGVEYKQEKKQPTPPTTTEFFSTTSAGDKSRITIHRVVLESGKNAYAVTTTFWTKSPEDYGGEWECLGKDKDGFYRIMSNSIYQYETWLLLTEKIKELHNQIKTTNGDK